MQPPAPRAGVRLPLEGLSRVALPNGATLLLLRDNTLPLISVQLHLPCGAIDDPAAQGGLAAFTLEMLPQGTRRRGADAIAEAVEAAGAALDTRAGYEASQLVCSGRREQLPLCLGLVAELVRAPAFAPAEIEEVRRRLLGEVKDARDSPATLAALHFANQLYGDAHPAGRAISAESLARIGRAELIAFHQRHIVPQGTVLAVTGDVDPAAVTRQVRQLFGGWRGHAPRRAPPPALPPLAQGLRVLLVDKPDLSQSFFALGHAGPRRSDPAHDALRLANYVLGAGGFSSRLMQQVRSAGGKTYGISSVFDDHRDDGAFRIASFTRHEELVATLRLVLHELRELRRRPPSSAELRGAKGQLAGGYVLEYQTAAHLASALARAQLHGLPDSYVSELPLRLDALTTDAVAAAVDSHLRSDALVGAVVGRAATVGPLLQRAGIAFTTISYLAPISAAERSAAARPLP
ncbi:MAG: insulinase family protein [Proteobacteria bacterium]|nr:insulinase family protein [Pseudomonadota bacterium]